MKYIRRLCSLSGGKKDVTKENQATIDTVDLSCCRAQPASVKEKVPLRDAT